jgi:tetratricopeptide (TPR) repeat protein
LSDREREPEEIVIRPADEVVPDWITQLGQTGTLKPVEELPAQEEEQPAWMAQLRETPPAPFSEQISAEVDTETPDWLAQLQASEPTLESESVVGEEPDWLAQLRASGGELETEEKAGPELDLGAAAAELAGLAGAAALFAAHEAGEETAEPALEPERPIDLAQPSELSVAELEQPPSSGVTAAAIEPEALEEMPSADDALAFLAKLAAGKEDQLRAQAQQEADARMAEIMGRKPVEAAPVAEDKPGPIKMTVPAATVAAVAAGLAARPTTLEEKPAEPEVSAVVPEEMPSADDALAFLAKLAVGKEDQLRAQAEQEAEERMAAIMGRKPTEARTPEPALEEKPPAGLAAAAAFAAGVAVVQKEEPPVEVPEEMPSADDALAFLAKLAAGKEDQLRAQAELEAEARMAAIMGRSAPLVSAQPIETAPAAEAIESLESLEAAEPVAETDLPEWLRAMRPTEESAELGLTALVEGEEAQVEVTPVEELPDWLRAQQPIGTAFEEVEAETEEAGAPVAEAAVAFGLLSTLGREQPVEVEEEPSTQDLVAELAALEQAASQAEAQLVEQTPVLPQTSALLPLEWWIQSATDTDEEPLAELPQPYLSPRARAAEKEKAAAAAAILTEEKPLKRKLPQTGPLRQTGPLAVPQTGPLGTPEQAAVSTEVEALLSRVYQDQQDYAARLDLARTYWATGNREGAYAEYLVLVSAGEFTKETMADLETIVEIHDQSDWHRMLGDVYMKGGRLSSALEHYRRALSEV